MVKKNPIELEKKKNKKRSISSKGNSFMQRVVDCFKGLVDYQEELVDYTVN